VENRNPASDGYNLKGQYGYHPHSSSKLYRNEYQSNDRHHGDVNVRSYGGNYRGRQQYDDDNETSGHVPSQVATIDKPRTKNDHYYDKPPQPPPPPPERRDDYSGSSTIHTYSTYTPSPQQQIQQRHAALPPRNDYNHRSRDSGHSGYRDSPPHSSDKSSRLSVDIPTSPVVPLNVNNNAEMPLPYGNPNPNGSQSFNNQRNGHHHSGDRGGHHGQQGPRRDDHHHSSHQSNHSQRGRDRDLPNNPQQSKPKSNQYPAKSPRIVLAENERRQSQARHVVLKEISQATNMKNSALDEKDRKFWERQIATLNESFKKL